MKFGTRYYNPAVGLFTQEDPSGQTAGYLYVGDSPVNGTDPTGEDFLGIASDINDISNAVSGAVSGDTHKLVGDLVGAVADVAADSACNFILGVADVPTAGVASVVGETGCTAAGIAAGNAASSAYDG